MIFILTFLFLFFLLFLFFIAFISILIGFVLDFFDIFHFLFLFDCTALKTNFLNFIFCLDTLSFSYSTKYYHHRAAWAATFQHGMSYQQNYEYAIFFGHG